MCLPPTFHAVAQSQAIDGSATEPSLGRGVIDLEAAREEVVAEVFNAPKRRVDNEVSRLADSAALLKMHVTIIGDLLAQYRRSKLTTYAGLVAGWLGGICLPASMFLLSLPLDIAGTAAACTFVGLSFATFVQNRNLSQLAEKLCSQEEVEKTFRFWHLNYISAVTSSIYHLP